MQPITTTHYIKGKSPPHRRLRRLRIQIIDLDGRRDNIYRRSEKNVLPSPPSEEIKATMEKARRDAEAKMQQENTGKPARPGSGRSAWVTPKITVPARQRHSRVILGQPTNETKVKMDMEMQAQNNGQAPPPPTPGQPNSVTFSP